MALDGFRSPGRGRNSGVHSNRGIIAGSLASDRHHSMAPDRMQKLQPEPRLVMTSKGQPGPPLVTNFHLSGSIFPELHRLQSSVAQAWSQLYKPWAYRGHCRFNDYKLYCIEVDSVWPDNVPCLSDLLMLYQREEMPMRTKSTLGCFCLGDQQPGMLLWAPIHLCFFFLNSLTTTITLSCWNKF